MFKLGKYARNAIRIVLYSIGLAVFLDERWIVAGGDPLDCFSGLLKAMGWSLEVAVVNGQSLGKKKIKR